MTPTLKERAAQKVAAKKESAVPAESKNGSRKATGAGKPSVTDKGTSSPAEKGRADEPFIPPPSAGKVKVVYSSGNKSFWALNDLGEYQEYTGELLNCLLRESGYDDKLRYATTLTYLETEKLRIARQQVVHYAGPLGGYQPGIYEMNGKRVLATTGFKPIKPVKGNWPLFRDFLQKLLGKEAKYFLAWLKHALDSLEEGEPWAPGQLLGIAGEEGAGKSLLQSKITPLLGGRVSSPYDYMTGKDKYNDEIYGAEHALIGDQNHRIDKNSRKAFGAAIKNLCVNPEGRVRGMYKGGCTLTTFIRPTITLNDNAYSLLVLPEMEKDVADKIMLLHAKKFQLPFPSKRFPSRHAFNDAIMAELPCFLYHLRRWLIPESIRDQRYGVVSYKSATLIDRMTALSSPWKLWSLIEMYVFRERDCFFWEGTSAELERLLRDQAKGENLSPLFYYPGACGEYLTHLEGKMEGVIEKEKIGGNLNWYTIHRTGPDLRPISLSLNKKKNP